MGPRGTRHRSTNAPCSLLRSVPRSPAPLFYWSPGPLLPGYPGAHPPRSLATQVPTADWQQGSWQPRDHDRAGTRAPRFMVASRTRFLAIKVPPRPSSFSCPGAMIPRQPGSLDARASRSIVAWRIKPLDGPWYHGIRSIKRPGSSRHPVDKAVIGNWPPSTHRPTWSMALIGPSIASVPRSYRPAWLLGAIGSSGTLAPPSHR